MFLRYACASSLFFYCLSSKPLVDHQRSSDVLVIHYNSLYFPVVYRQSWCLRISGLSFKVLHCFSNVTVDHPCSSDDLVTQHCSSKVSVTLQCSCSCFRQEMLLRCSNTFSNVSVVHHCSSKMSQWNSLIFDTDL